MGIGRSGKKTATTKMAKSKTVTPFYDHSGAVGFAPLALRPEPPKDWEAQHAAALRATVLARQASTVTVRKNRPIPRLASCHFSSAAVQIPIDSPVNTIYFY